MTGTDVQVLSRGSMDPFQIMDSWDEQQMLEEMQGAIAKTLVYEFPLDGKRVTGLSKIGVDECCIVLAKEGQVIREVDVTFQLRGEGEKEEALFKAVAARFAVSPSGEVLLDQVIGVKRQPLYEFRKGKLASNPHWYETGAMKAVRNARFRLIPSKTREAVITMAKAAGSVRQMDEHPSGKGALPQDPEEVESQALKELLEILPNLAANQQEWVKGKLGDGASPVDLLEFAREKMPRPKGGGTTKTPGASATASTPEIPEQNPAGGDGE